jgi:hypothetical protein
VIRWYTSSLVGHPAGFIEPCVPTVSRSVPIGVAWVYEIKHNGFRFICRDGQRMGASATSMARWNRLRPPKTLVLKVELPKDWPRKAMSAGLPRFCSISWGMPSSLQTTARSVPRRHRRAGWVLEFHSMRSVKSIVEWICQML